jgi:hypothetical protein
MLFEPASMERVGQNARCLGQGDTDRTGDVKRADIEYIWWTPMGKSRAVLERFLVVLEKRGIERA